MNDWPTIANGFFGVDWSDKGGSKEALHRCDPYLVWTDLTTFDLASNALQSAPTGDEPSVLIERDKALTWVPPQGVRFNHWHDIDDTPFVTMSFALDKTADVVRDLVRAVRAGKIERFTWQAPRRLSRPAAPLQPFASPQGDHALSGTWNANQPKTSKVLVGIIDDGCPYTNAAYWDVQGPRLLAMWQQDRDMRPPPPATRGTSPEPAPQPDDFEPIADDPPAGNGSTGKPTGAASDQGFIHGGELTGRRLSEVRARLSERATHRRMDFRPMGSTDSRTPPALRRASHGSQVMSFAVAEPNPLVMRHRAKPNPDAPQIAFVQLPEAGVDDTSGSSLAANALDGIHYLLMRARGRKLIVNLSYGTYAGPHDGTSMFERALCDLLERHKKLSVVLPAGNSHLQRSHVRGHLGQGTADNAGTQTLQWRVLPDDATDGFVEVWFPPGAQASVRITPPGGEPSQPITAGSAFQLVDGTIIQGAVIFPKEVAQGLNGTMALIAVAPTRRVARPPAISAHGKINLDRFQAFKYYRLTNFSGLVRNDLLAPHGTWLIEIANTGAQAFDFHAWIERDDAAPDLPTRRRRAAGRQSYFVDDSCGRVAAESTLNGIATLEHRRVHVVGAMQRGASMCRDTDTRRGGDISDYSSAGPNRGSGDRCSGPDAVTFADDSRHLPGLLGGGVLSGSRVRGNGTSVAAALYTRLLAKYQAHSDLLDLPFALSEPGHEMREPPVFPTAPRPASKWLRGIFNRFRP